MRKKLARVLAAFSLSFPLAIGALVMVPGIAAAQNGPAVVEFCKELVEDNAAAGLPITVGGCVAAMQSENPTAFIAALCQNELVQQLTGTTSVGKCVVALKELLIA